MRVSLKRYSFLWSPKTRAWMAFCLFGSLVLAVIELVLARVLISILKLIGFESAITASNSGLSFLESEGGATVFLAIIALAFIRFFCQYLVNQSTSEINEGVISRLRKALFFKILKNSSGRFTRQDSHFWFGSVFQSTGLATHFLTHSVSYSLQSLLISVFMICIAPRESLVALVGIAGIGMVVFYTNRRVRKTLNHIPDLSLKLTETIDRLENNIILVKIGMQENNEWVKCRETINQIYSNSCYSARLTNLAASAAPLLGLLLLLSILSFSLANWDTSSSSLMMFLYLFVRFVQGLATTANTISNFSQYYHHFGKSLAYVSELTSDEISLLDKEVIDNYSDRFTLNHNIRHGIGPKISAENVFFHIGDREIISDLSFAITGGEFLAIVGPSGSGKSTFLDILLGLSQPTPGSCIAINEKRLDKPLYRSDLGVSYVGPTPFLLEGRSLQENLCYGFDSLVESDVLIDALERVGFFTSQPKESSAEYFHRSIDFSKLSSGERQKVALARVFVSRADIIILDEATSNLDDESEKKVIAELLELKGKSTLIFVTHRKQPLELADRILEFHDFGYKMRSQKEISF